MALNWFSNRRPVAANRRASRSSSWKSLVLRAEQHGAGEHRGQAYAAGDHGLRRVPSADVQVQEEGLLPEHVVIGLRGPQQDLAPVQAGGLVVQLPQLQQGLEVVVSSSTSAGTFSAEASLPSRPTEGLASPRSIWPSMLRDTPASPPAAPC